MTRPGPRLRRLLPLALCGLAVAALGAIPPAWFALTDAALLNRGLSQSDPYTSLSPTADDYYLIRQLRTQMENTLLANQTGTAVHPEVEQSRSVYLPAEEFRYSMSTAGSDMRDYLESLLAELYEGDVLTQTAYDRIMQAVTSTDSQGIVYYSTDSLGFVRLSIFSDTDNENLPTVSLMVDSKTGRVVWGWFCLPEPLYLDPAVALPAWVELSGLDGLGDWGPPPGQDYAESGLYSRNGQLLVACATVPLSVYRTIGVGEVERWALVLQMTPKTWEVDLP